MPGEKWMKVAHRGMKRVLRAQTAEGEFPYRYEGNGPTINYHVTTCLHLSEALSAASAMNPRIIMALDKAAGWLGTRTKRDGTFHWDYDTSYGKFFVTAYSGSALFLTRLHRFTKDERCRELAEKMIRRVHARFNPATGTLRERDELKGSVYYNNVRKIDVTRPIWHNPLHLAAHICRLGKLIYEDKFDERTGEEQRL